MYVDVRCVLACVHEGVVDGVGDFGTEGVDAVVVRSVGLREVLDHPFKRKSLLTYDGRVQRW
jgi:hypothetical protein